MAKSMKNGEEDELMLELSIGGIFEKPNKSNRIVSKSVESMERGDRIEDVDVGMRRRVQALRRRDWRRKREEKVKKSVDFCLFMEDDDDFLEPVRKKERIGSLLEDIGLNSAAPVTNGFVNRKVIPVVGDDVKKKNCVLSPAVCRSFGPYDMYVKANEDDGGRRICKGNSNGSGGCGSSVYSDGQCSSHQGVTTDDSRSNSSNSQLDQQLASTSGASTDPYDQPTGSSKQTISTTKLANSTIPKPSLVNPHEPSVSNPHCKPETSIQHQQATFLARMPSVSTTGNGPNGKTVSGFLYRYTKGEVSIVCVCHGHLFTPAGFVEHAGGVDIAHPLKHITIFPTAFAS